MPKRGGARRNEGRRSRLHTPHRARLSRSRWLGLARVAATHIAKVTRGRQRPSYAVATTKPGAPIAFPVAISP